MINKRGECMKILTICIPCDKDTISIHSIVESTLILSEYVELLFVLNKDAIHLRNDILIWKEKLGKSIKYVDSNDDVIKEAKGLYFKLLSPRASIEQSGLLKVVNTLQDLLRSQISLDVLVCDYEYKVSGVKKDIYRYNSVMVQDDIVEWHQMKLTNYKQYFNSKSMIFKTNILKQNNYCLFDYSIYQSCMLPIYLCYYAKTFLYTTTVLEVLNKENQELYLSEVDQGIEQIKAIILSIDISDVKSRKARSYIVNHTNRVLLRIASVLLQEGSVESIQKKEALWYYLRIHNYILYKQCKKMFHGKLMDSDNNKVMKQIIKRVIK